MRSCKLFIAAVSVIFAAGCSAKPPDPPVTAAETPPAAPAVTAAAEAAEDYIPRANMLECAFYDSESFALWNGKAKEYPFEGDITCGAVPHHLAAGHLISGFFKAAAKSGRRIDTVVIAATSHYAGGSSFYTTDSDWDSPFGIVETDADITKHFKSALGAVCDDDRLEKDHSASSHIPFIKYYLPGAKTACVLVGPGREKENAEKLANALAEVPGAENCLFLFSIDFSHYLLPAEADAYDGITRAAVAEKKLDEIERFDNKNVDSPTLLSALVRLSDLLGKELFEADNSNTLKVNEMPYSEKDYPEGVTSYFVYMC